MPPSDHQRIADLWIAPLSAAGHLALQPLAARLQALRRLWETSQYLEATINSIPSLVWYKSGRHPP
ncbi:MAG: hypothetical protein ACLSVD_11600 [Eggerthellaceae bacterium]